jgi:hypothetical protein
VAPGDLEVPEEHQRLAFARVRQLRELFHQGGVVAWKRGEDEHRVAVRRLYGFHCVYNPEVLREQPPDVDAGVAGVLLMVANQFDIPRADKLVQVGEQRIDGRDRNGASVVGRVAQVDDTFTGVRKVNLLDDLEETTHAPVLEPHRGVVVADLIAVSGLKISVEQ